MVRDQVQRAKEKDRDELLDQESRPRNDDSRPFLVLSFHPAISKKIYDIVRETHPILIAEAEHERVFSDLPLVSFRRAKNLKDSLVRAAVPVLHTNPGCDACHMGRGCKCCDVIEKATSFTSTSTGRTFQIRAENLNCKSTGIVYLLQCKKCRIQNVGSTMPRFHLRVNTYRDHQKLYCRRKAANTLHKKPKVPQNDLHAHFEQDDHNGFSDYSFILIDQADNEADLRRRESFWQYRLETFTPQGLNKYDVPFQLEVRAQEKFQ